MVELVPAVYGDVVFIARNMRDLDVEEIMPLIWSGKAEDLAAMSCTAGGIAIVALSGGCPVAAYGAFLSRPLMWTVWMFATDRWSEVALAVTKDIKRRIMPQWIDAGAVRCECWSMEGHDTAHRWLESLGATREASIEDYGPSRKTYHCYSWTRSRLERDGDFNHVFRTLRSKSAGSPGAPAPARAAPDAGRSGGECRGHGKTQTAVGGQGA